MLLSGFYWALWTFSEVEVAEKVLSFVVSTQNAKTQ